MSYVIKKSDTPEKVSKIQETFEKFSKGSAVVKAPSPVPISISFIGLIFSGSQIGFQTFLFLVLLIVISGGNLLYYGYAVIALLLQYRLMRKNQDYEFQVPQDDKVGIKDTTKREEREHEKEMKQMELDHQKEMHKMDLEKEMHKMDTEKEIHQMDLKHAENMKKMELEESSFHSDNLFYNNGMLPPVDAAESLRKDN